MDDPSRITQVCDRENMAQVERMTGQELQELRNELGWTQYFLADVLGVPRSSIAHWEQGRARVPVNVASGMKKAAGVLAVCKAASGMERHVRAVLHRAMTTG